MKKSKYEVDRVIRSLNKKNDIKIDSRDGIIYILANGSKSKINDLGNGSWGKIDFLVNYHGFFIRYVSELPKKGREKSELISNIIL